MLAKAMWAHGHGMAIEHPDRIVSEWRAGFYIRVIGRQNTNNWFHFAIPTSVIVSGRRLRADAALIRFRAKSSVADVTNVHVFDGENRIANHDGLNLSPTVWTSQRFAIANKPEVRWGLGLTLGVRFAGSTNEENTLEFSAAGIDLVA